MTDKSLLNALGGVADHCAAIVRAATPERVHRKAPQDYVTDVDMRLDEYIESALTTVTPGVPVLSEERPVGVAAPVAEYWIVDPLDGTSNLIAGIPFVAVSIALVDAQGPVFAAVAAPFQDRIWTAARNTGAFAQSLPLRLPSVPPELIVASTGVMDRLKSPSQDDKWSAIRRTGKLRNFGAQSLHLCGVAEGWFAAALSVEAQIWDEAAAGLIVREAGGIWRSNADTADWRDPHQVMGKQQESIACHPSVYEGLADIMLERSLIPAK